MDGRQVEDLPTVRRMLSVFDWMPKIRAVTTVLAISPFVILFAVRWIRASLAVLRSRQWLETSGQILGSGIQISTHRGGHGTLHSTYPKVFYQYQVGGQILQGNRIHLGTAIGGIGAQSAAARFPVGSIHPVYYNPNNPSESVLEKRARGNWLNLVLIVLLLAGLAAFV